MGLNLEYIDGQTPIDENERTGLKIKTISTQAELDAFEQQNIEEAIEWTLKKSPSIETILSEDFINLVHHKMFRNVWQWAGTYRISNKNIGVNYYQIAQDLRILLGDIKFWIDNSVFLKDEIAIRFKHGLVAIHLYPNGNGRHSRLMGDVLVRAFNKDSFSWGSHTISRDKVRQQYIDALRKADGGNFEPLISFSRS